MTSATVRLLGLAAVMTAWSIMGAAVAAHAGGVGGTITCGTGTTVLYRAVGSQTAPMLVPAQVPATICSRNGTVVSVIPSFQAVGPSSAPMIVPMNLGITKCVPTTTATVPTVGGGLTPPLQLVQVGPGLFVVSSTVASATTAVALTPPVLTCF